MDAALLATLIFCHNGRPAVDAKCPDGSPAIQRTISVLTSDLHGKESLINIMENETEKFSLKPDGSMSHAPGFSVDQAALSFWIAMANTYRPICPDISSVLDQIKPK